ncbi:SMP-30/gluconolactonase/LRE family protein [Pseudonocardia ailaonensis]|uniref:SMP-30/gluconolactonase/LRE family protein n=1 Tax=Pseudonocardia ailaonensis TaxID=367279 RepID=A0ABN2N590_9PSEU
MTTSTAEPAPLLTGVEVEWIASGLGGSGPDGELLGVAEGPVWFPDRQALSVNDSSTSTRHEWTEATGLTTVATDTGAANGSTRDRQGRLLSCEQARRRVVRHEPDGSVTVVADRYRGLALNRPNDVVVRSDGSIWFTDPLTFGVDTELDHAAVFRVSPDLSRINLVARDFNLPNGLAFSPDERTLYINDTNRMHIRAMEVESWSVAGSRLDPDTDRVVITMSGGPGQPDGMRLDAAGNIWCTGPDGIWVVAPDGAHLATLDLGGRLATNLCFGGPDLRTLFVTTFTEVGRIRVGIPGLDPDREVTAPDGPVWTAGGKS